MFKSGIISDILKFQFYLIFIFTFETYWSGCF